MSSMWGRTTTTYMLSTPQDGAFKWKYPTQQRVVSSPAVAAQENLVVFGSMDNQLYALDMRTGQVSWSVRTGGPVQSSPSIAHGHVFFGSDDGRLYAVRLSTGRVQWTWAGGLPVRTRPLVTGEFIVVGLELGEVVGLDLSGKIIWRFKAKRGVTSSPLEHDGLVYFGSMDWQLYALDITRGWKAWEFRTGKAVISSPTYGDEKLFIAIGHGAHFVFFFFFLLFCILLVRVRIASDTARSSAALASATRNAMARMLGPCCRAKRCANESGSALTMKLISPWR